MDREYMTDDDLREKLEKFLKETTMKYVSILDHMDLSYNTLNNFREEKFQASKVTWNKIFNFLQEREERVDD